MPAELFAAHLKELHVKAGRPTVRMLATRTRYGRTTIHEALAGRRLPTWEVAKALIGALDGDMTMAREMWVAAQGRPSGSDHIPDWLTAVRADLPQLATGRGLVDASALAHTDPRAAIEDGWEVIRLSGGQLAADHYGDIPGNWSSDIVATFRRGEADSVLPSGMSTVVQELNRIRVHAHVTPEEVVAVALALQYVTLAYRVAYQVYDTMYGRSRTNHDDLVAVSHDAAPAGRPMPHGPRPVTSAG